MAHHGGSSFEASSPQQCTERESRQSTFRKLISEVSEHLRPEEVAKCSFIRRLPPDKNLSALETLSYLMQTGAFSHSNVDPLVNLLKDVKRHDLVTELVDPYRDLHPDEISHSLPAGSVTSKPSAKDHSSTVPADITHSLSLPQSTAVQEMGTVHAFSTQDSFNMSHQNGGPPASSYTQQNGGPPASSYTQQLTPEQSAGDVGLQRPHTAPIAIVKHTDEGLMRMQHRNSAQLQRTFIPVATHDGGYSERPQSMSASSSIAEMQRYQLSSSENILEMDPSSCAPPLPPRPDKPAALHPEETTPTKSHTARPRNMAVTLRQSQSPSPMARANSYPRGIKLQTQLATAQPPSHTQNNVVTPPSSLTHHAHMMPGASGRWSATRRSVTPPACYNKHTSAPIIHFRPGTGAGGYQRHSLPHGISYRPSSRASESEISRPNSACNILDHTILQPDIEQSPNGVFPSSQETAPSYASSVVEADSEAGQQMPLGFDVLEQSSTLFRRRASSKKGFLGKFRWLRNRSASKSNISWSVKRDKLNEAIYKPRKNKHFKCPDELELENGGKHPAKLSLSLHPYGYEEDAGHNLTLSVEMAASVKSNIPSSARVHVEVTASESTRGTRIAEAVLENSADCRILRHKGFLSHEQLKVLECEHIEIVATATLFNLQ